jgi:hypothetical protein
MVHALWRHREFGNYNGQPRPWVNLAICWNPRESGGTRPLNHTFFSVGWWAVTIRPVRTISRKPRRLRDPQRLHARPASGPAPLAVKVQSDPRGDTGSQTEMIWPLDGLCDSANASRSNNVPKGAKFLVG